MKHLDTVKLIPGDTPGVAPGHLAAESLPLGNRTTFVQELLQP